LKKIIRIPCLLYRLYSSTQYSLLIWLTSQQYCDAPLFHCNFVYAPAKINEQEVLYGVS